MKIELLDITPNATELIERIGRICYNSKPGENYVKGTMVKNLIKNGHTSVLEHAKATFVISDVSRSLTHQLVRHRLASYTQQSQRYVKFDKPDFIIPEKINREFTDDEILADKNEECKLSVARKLYDNAMQQCWFAYKALVDNGMKPEDARFVLPNAATTVIAVTANFREWRSIFELRCEKHAQWEIRNLCNKLLEILHSKEPNVFDDQVKKFIESNENGQ